MKNEKLKMDVSQKARRFYITIVALFATQMLLRRRYMLHQPRLRSEPRGEQRRPGLKMKWQIKALKERAIPKAPRYYVGDMKHPWMIFLDDIEFSSMENM